MLVQVAWAATHTKGTYLSTKYKKLASRIGKKKAVIAIARKILESLYHILKKKEPYLELGKEYLDTLHRNRNLRYYKKRLEELGCEVHLSEKVS